MWILMAKNSESQIENLNLYVSLPIPNLEIP